MTPAQREIAIATSRFWSHQLIRESGLVPVGHTVGAPKFGMPEAGNLGVLAPHGIDRTLTERRFRRLYVERLERFGVEKIAGLLRAVADAYDAPGVVLLCFEDLTQPGQWCHRRIFADWWEKQTGQPVPELAPAQAAIPLD